MRPLLIQLLDNPQGRTPMDRPDSVSFWLDQLKAGDGDAARKLWERYFPRLVQLARSKLGAAPRRMADEEDVAQSVFHSFYQAIHKGRYADLSDRDNLWPLLVVITANKAAKAFHHERRQKRGGGRVRDEAALEQLSPAGDGLTLEQIIGREPTPEFALAVAEEYQRLLAKLHDPELEKIALMRQEGYRTEEIAAQLGCTRQTIERRLKVIRSLWAKEGEL